MISCAVSAVSPSTYITNNPSTNTGPTISGISPASNVLNVPQNVVIKISFAQAVKFGTKYIQLKTSKGQSVPITTTISGRELTIKPDNLLTKGTKYVLILHSGSITDLAGKPIVLTTTTFTTSTNTVQTTISSAEAQKIASAYILVISAKAGTPKLVDQNGRLLYIVPVVMNKINVGEIDIDAHTGKNLGGAGGAP